MIKAIFFDVDGTLIPLETGIMPVSTTQCLHLLKKKGIKCVVCTGRHKTALDGLPLEKSDFDGFLTLNGQLCLDGNLNVYGGNEIDPGEVEILAGIFRAKKIPFLLIGENSMYINYVDNIVLDTQMHTNGNIPDISEYKGEQIYQCCAFVTHEQRDLLESILDECDITSWFDTGIDIIPKHGGKDVGMEKFLEKYGMTREETMAFGDGENDIPMLKFAGIGVAMGNASDAVKEAADYVTDNCIDNGIIKALIHFGIIGKNEIEI